MRKKTNVLKVLVSVVFTFAMAFGVMTAMPSGGVAAADGSTICQLAADGSFQTSAGDPAICQEFADRLVSGTGPCQLVVGSDGQVISQGDCEFGDATVTAVPSVTVTTVPSETATETETAVPSETATETETAVPSETATETETAVPSETATETETAVVTETPVVTETEVVTETAVETEVVPVVTETTTSGGNGTGTDTSGGSGSGSSVAALPDTGSGSSNSSSNSTFVALFGALAAVGVGGAYALRRRTR
jgi:hypothetical protein